MLSHKLQTNRITSVLLSTIKKCQRQKPIRGFSSVPTYDYDLVIIGSGPAGQKCAIDASQRGKRVAIVDKSNMYGGVCVHTGTIPSKTFREAVLHLTGYQHKEYYGTEYAPAGSMGKINCGGLEFNDILQRVHKVIRGELTTISDQARVNNIRNFSGLATFLDSNTVVVKHDTNPYSQIQQPYNKQGGDTVLSAEKFLVSTGTRPLHPSHISFDGERILDSDDMLAGKMRKMPKHFIVMGSGVIGMEYASMINIIPGCNSTIIDQRDEILPFMDKELTQTLKKIMRDDGARFLMNESVQKVERCDDTVSVTLESGKVITGDALLYAVGRKTTVDELNLQVTGDLELDDRGLIKVNESYQSTVPHIYAAGDVIGFPALASTAMEQGRMASCHMWGMPLQHRISGFPYGIYTIPEMGMIGKTEQQLTEENVNYEVGIAQMDEITKGQLLGGTPGVLKILFHTETRKVLGVHCLGENATEIVHIGQLVMDMDQPLDYFVQTVFNYPTFAEAYRVAAFDGLKRIETLSTA